MSGKSTGVGNVVAALVGCAIAGGAAFGQLNAYEPFDYTPIGSDLSGKSGGGSFGFAGPWQGGGFNASIFDHADIAAGSLAFGNLLTSGNRVTSAPQQAIAGVTRPLAVPLGAPGTTQYFSFVVRPEGQLNAGAFNGFFTVLFETAAEPELAIGKPGAGTLDRYMIEERGGGGQVASNVPVVVNQTALLVVKAQFGAAAANDVFTLYVNPTPGGAEPAGGTVKSDANLPLVTGLTLYSTGAFSADELRVGNTFASVTPAVPEPAILTLMALGATALVARPRRRRPRWDPSAHTHKTR
jgi:hypothetical protein